MASNLITINYSKELEWIVPDSQMDKVITLLSKIGDRHFLTSCDTASLPCLLSDYQPLPSPQVV